MQTTLKIAVFAGILALAPVPADQWDKKTTITIDAPMQTPTTTLQPGTYTLKLLESPSNRHIVTIWDKDGMKLITTILAIPNYRLQPTGDSKFTFWETPADQPKALRAWFYPGDNFGQEFAYPKEKAEKIALVTKTEVPVLTESDETRIAAESTKAESTKTEVAAAEPKKEEPKAPEQPAVVEQVPAPPPPAVRAEPEPAPAPPPPAAEQPQAQAGQADLKALPQTASNWNELTLLGLLAGIIGLATFGVRRTA